MHRIFNLGISHVVIDDSSSSHLTCRQPHMQTDDRTMIGNKKNKIGTKMGISSPDIYCPDPASRGSVFVPACRCASSIYHMPIVPSPTSGPSKNCSPLIDPAT